MVDVANIFESFTAEKKPPKYPDNAPNRIAIVNHGTYFHAR